jgi:hypothetical protein
MLIALSLNAHAGKPTAKIDTLKLDALGGVSRFVAGWEVTATTTTDSFVVPIAGSYALVINHGSIGDTLKISWAQPGRANMFSTELIGGHDAISFEFPENIIKHIVLKAASGTIGTHVVIKR